MSGVDGLRGIAILWTLLYHASLVMGFSEDVAFVKWFLLSGWMGVDLFFVISGFLITGILCDSRHSPGYYRNFYARRVLRIFPLYYALLVLSFFIWPHLSDKQVLTFDTSKPFFYWIFAYNLAVSFGNQFPFGTLGPVWSLAIEEQFYCVWPTLVRRFTSKGLMRLCIALILTAIGTRCILSWKGLWITNYYFTLTRMDSILVGAVVALLARGQLGVEKLSRIALTAGGTALLALAAGFIYSGDAGWGKPFTNRFGFTLDAIVFASLILLAVVQPRSSLYRKLLDSRLLQALGKYSYAIYLLQLPLLTTLLSSSRKWLPALSARHPALVGAASVTVFIALGWVCGLISYHAYEKRFLRLKKHFC